MSDAHLNRYNLFQKANLFNKIPKDNKHFLIALDLHEFNWLFNDFEKEIQFLKQKLQKAEKVIEKYSSADCDETGRTINIKDGVKARECLKELG